jgi:hypothetical protein
VNVGATIAGYELTEVLARDDGRVLAIARPPWQPRLARVALEVIPADRDAAVLWMMLDELALTCAVRHGNLQRLYDLGRDGDRAYVAAELLEGASADELPALPASAAAAIGVAACAALAHLHRLVDRDGRDLAWVYRELWRGTVHVGCDGVVRLAYPGRRSWHRSRNIAVRNLAPEQVTGGPIDARTDVLLAGALVWELVTGRPRFDGDASNEAVLTRTVREPMPRLSSLRDDVPHVLDDAVARAVELDPAARGSIAELAAALDSAGPATARELAELVRVAYPDRARRFAAVP